VALKPVPNMTAVAVEISPDALVVDATGQTSVTLPDGFSFGDAQFVQHGPDLVLTAPDGTQVVVKGFYANADVPDLVTAEGGQLYGDTAVRLAQANSPVQVAQDGTATAAQPIGEVESVRGTVIAIRSDGTRIELQEGDPVFQGDILESGNDASVGIVLADDTTFSMANNGRMVLDEMVYDPVTQDGNISMSVLQGVFTFVSGQVAKVDPDAMVLKTPVATIGVRGTQVGIDLTGGASGTEGIKVVLMTESDGFVGEVVVTNNAGVQILNQPEQGLSVFTANDPPSDPQTFTRGEISQSFGGALRSLPTSVGTGNTYDADQGGNTDQEQEQDEEPEPGQEEGAGDGEQQQGAAEGEQQQAAADSGEPAGDETGDEPDEEPDEGLGDGTEEGEFETASGEDGTDLGDDIAVTEGEQVTTGETVVQNQTTQFGGAPTGPAGGGNTAGTTNTQNDTTQNTVTNSAPVAGASPSFSMDEDGSVQITSAQLLAGTTDPDGDTLSITSLSADGGSLTPNGAGSWTFTPNANFNGQINLTYTISDGTANVVQSATVNVAAVNDAASIGGTVTGTVTEDMATQLTTSGALTISDPDAGEEIFAAQTNTTGTYGSFSVDSSGNWTYSATNSQDAIQQLGAGDTLMDTFTVATADGTTKAVTITINGTNDIPVVGASPTFSMNEDGTLEFTAAQLLANASDVDGDSLSVTGLTANGGTLTPNEAGTAWTFEPAANFNGQVTLSYDVTDGTANVAQSATVTVNAVNDAPVAGASPSFSMNEDGTLQITAAQLLAGASDVDGDDLSVANLMASGGTLTPNEAGTAWTFEPAADFNGTVTLSYDVSDGTASVAQTAAVTVNAVNDAPVAGASPSFSMNEDGGFIEITKAQLLANSSDVDGDSLSVANLAADGGTLVETSDGVWKFTPAADFNGTVTLSYDVSDGTASVAQTAAVNVAAVNDAPTVSTTIADQSTNEDAAYSYDASVNFADVDTGDTLTFSAQLSGGGGLPAWLSIDTNTGVLSGTPENNAVGSISVEVTASDGSASVTDTYVLTVSNTNDAPTVSTAIADQSTNEDAAYCYNTSVNFTDVDAGDTLTYTAELSGGGGLPAWLSIDADTGVLSGTPENGDVGAISVEVTATDAAGATVSDTFVLTVNNTNDTPTIGGAAAGAVTEDSNVIDNNISTSGALTISDPDVGESSFTAQTNTAGTYGSFSVDTSGNWTYTADNTQTEIQQLGDSDTLTDTFTVTSADGTTQNVTITINGTNDAPTIGGTTTGLVTEDTSVTNDNISTSGVLTIADTDAGEASFTAQSNTAGTYGSFSVDTSGNWSYSADNTQTAIQQLGDGDTLTDTFTVASADGTTQNVTITINGTNDAPTIGGVSTGSVTEDASVTDDNISTSGALTISDTDAGEASFTAQTNISGTYGTFSVNSAGAWTYVADNTQTAIQQLGDGDTLTDNFTVTSADGTTQSVTITINGTNDAPTIGGVSTGSVTEDTSVIDDNISASGTLTISDADAGQANFTAQTNTAGTYGSLSVDTSGNWSYVADNTQTAIQQLGDGDTLTDTFTVASADGTTQNVTITINGTNDAPTIGGVSTGSVTEDASVIDDNISTSGALTISDTDAGEASFTAQTNTAGTYGSFSVDTSGNWTYTADNTQTAIQQLGDGDTLTDSFTVASADGTTQNVTITINGTNDAPTIGGVSTGSVTEDTSVTDGNISTSGTLTITDTDANESNFTAQTNTSGTYGSFSVDTSGNWTYTADNTQSAIQQLGDGDTLTDTFTVTSADGTTQSVTITINGTNDAPVIGGVSTGAVTEDSSVADDKISTSGALTITDADAGEDSFTAQTNTSGTYGTFSVDTSGNWTYTADNTQSAIQQLGDGDTLTDTFTVTSADGTTQSVTITINGTNDAPTLGGATTGSVTEDMSVTDDNISTSGALTITDTDSGEASFTAQTNTAGTYGSFSVDTSGNWSYTADNSQTAIQQLGDGDTLTDSFTVASADGTTTTVSVTINGTNDAPTIGGATTGSVTEDTSVTNDNISTSGALTISDTDAGEAVFTAQSNTAGTYGSFTVDTSGNWTYTADNTQTAIQQLGDGDTLTDTFTVASADGTTQSVTITINGTNDAPVAQSSTATVSEDGSVSGQLVATDVDSGDTLTYSIASTGTSQTLSAGGAYASEGDWKGSGVTINAFNFGTAYLDGTSKFDASLADGSPVFTVDGVGVEGTQGTGQDENQIEYDPTAGETEALAMTFNSQVSEARFTIDRLFHSEGDAGEKGTWQAFDADGTLVGTGLLNSSTVDYDGSTNEGVLTINLDDTGNSAFQTVVFTANAITGSVSDYTIREVSYDTAPTDGSPANGTVQINSDGSYTYTPADDFSGTDSFTYQVTDDSGATSTATVSVTVTADNDVLAGTSSVDTHDGGAGNDTIYGGTKDDILYGGAGNDTLYGENHDDTLYGGIGNDFLYGGNHDDTLYGGSGIDYLDGGAHSDIIYGEEGNDIILGGTGDDSFYGGDGNDEFIFNLGDGEDIIFDFADGDKMTFKEVSSTDDVEFSVSGDDVIVTVGGPGNGNSSTVTLKDAAIGIDPDTVADGYTVTDTGDDISVTVAPDC